MRVAGVPVFLWFAGLLGVAMLGPALYAFLEEDWRSGRLFLFSGIFAAFAASVLAAAARRLRPTAQPGREELLTLVGVFAAGPLFAAAPIWLLRPEIGPFGAWFEAVSSLSTTGATLIEGTAPPALHLWRAMLGWIGGLATLTAAAAVLSPRELIDLPGMATAELTAGRGGRALALAPGGRRAMRAARALAPVYLAFTAGAVVLLEALGLESFDALVLAMGLVSTSGIGAGEAVLAPGGEGGRWVEAAALLCLLLAGTRWHHAWRRGSAGAGLAGPSGASPRRRLGSGRFAGMATDPEFRLAGFALAVATLWLWLPGAAAWAQPGGPSDGARAAWGALATAVSFLTTSGYASADWPAARDWAGLKPGEAGLLLAGLATLGGGVATTAGGVKLYRAWALYRHGRAEVARLPQPFAVDSARTAGGEIQRRAIVNAWVAVMLYLAALALVMLAMAASGLGFAPALFAAAAALANCGPLLPEAAGLGWAALPRPALAAASIGMVLGRIELVAAVALLNPSFWRR